MCAKSLKLSGETWFYRELSCFPSNSQIDSIHCDTWRHYGKTEMKSIIISWLQHTRHTFLTLHDSQAVEKKLLHQQRLFPWPLREKSFILIKSAAIFLLNEKSCTKFVTQTVVGGIFEAEKKAPWVEFAYPRHDTAPFRTCSFSHQTATIPFISAPCTFFAEIVLDLENQK